MRLSSHCQQQKCEECQSLFIAFVYSPVSPSEAIAVLMVCCCSCPMLSEGGREFSLPPSPSISVSTVVCSWISIDPSFVVVEDFFVVFFTFFTFFSEVDTCICTSTSPMMMAYLSTNYSSTHSLRHLTRYKYFGRRRKWKC